jgi:hypothetical protein
MFTSKDGLSNVQIVVVVFEFGWIQCVAVSTKDMIVIGIVPVSSVLIRFVTFTIL